MPATITPIPPPMLADVPTIEEALYRGIERVELVAAAVDQHREYDEDHEPWSVTVETVAAVAEVRAYASQYSEQLQEAIAKIDNAMYGLASRRLELDADQRGEGGS